MQQKGTHLSADWHRSRRDPVSRTLPAGACANRWPKGKIAAVALTYDDALHSQLDVAIPQLDAAGFKGTFFLDGDITPADMLRWRKAQRSGHELGNHSLFHPCPRAMLPDRKNYLTENYDVDRMLGEIAAMNNVLFGIDGADNRARTPCPAARCSSVASITPMRCAAPAS